MKLHHVAILSLIAVAIPAGAVAAFFMYVSPLTILCVATALVAMLILGGLEIAWGRHLRRSFRKPAPQMMIVPSRIPARSSSELSSRSA